MSTVASSAERCSRARSGSSASPSWLMVLATSVGDRHAAGGEHAGEDDLHGTAGDQPDERADDDAGQPEHGQLGAVEAGEVA